MKLSLLKGGVFAAALVLVGAGCAAPVADEVTTEQVVVSSVLSVGTYTLDTDVSTMEWYGEKVVPGKNHEGTVAIQSGDVVVDDAGIISGGTIVIDMNSIDGADEPALLINHLKNEDFFNTEKFSVATLTLNGSTANENDVYTVSGELTIKDVTHTISFPATITMDAGMATAEATFEIDRTLWDIQYGSGKFFASLGDNVIKDEMRFTLRISANDLEVVTVPEEAETEALVEPEPELVN